MDEIDETVRGLDGSLRLLDSLEALRLRLAPEVIVRLALPFEAVASLDLDAPDLRLMRNLSESEPPSIYIMSPGFLDTPHDREEYRLPYSETPWGERFTAEYVCGRSLYERERGWEYSKTVWVNLRQPSN
ncbi:hypothetical protein [uncultured Microbacterium sp.]|uniref:hypothetical protein n=1 Tax=uncultured Microbacterium sp. TaxID=191216 RepID=UPI0025E130CB|nr:hypothetical protein [uncultured Microbacterium sp.]